MKKAALCEVLVVLAVLLLLQQAPALSRQGRPPHAPDAALSTFRIAEGFTIELVAAEPLVASPVAMEVDEHGRMYVVEMPGYPLDVSGSGRIIVLEDTTSDGRPDRRTVFADGLRLPTGIMKWKAGVLVTDSPHVWYLEDTDGDGRADVKREVLNGFALSNPQHNTNAPVYGLDNWIYLANEGAVRTIKYRDLFGDRGGEVRFPDNPAAPRLPPNADGRNVRFRPDTHELEMLAARSQFGQTFDEWGRHFLVVHNRHIYHEVIAARYLTRNPSLVVPSVIEQLPDYPLPVALFPITHDPDFELLTDVGVMTAASGLTWYLADLFPPAYRNAVFVAESAHNLVHVSSVRPHGPTFRASRMFDDREFLASTDAWFRPVNFYLGPDGALYLLDYYRRIIEHPEWMDEARVRSADLAEGHELGRIYRIVPSGTPQAAWLNRLGLADAPLPELVRTLEHPNLWWRRHAQRLLVDRRPPEAADLLVRLAAESQSAVGRLHALWTLEGLGRLEPAAIERALTDPAAGVRENAVRLAELRLGRVPSLAAPLLPIVSDPDARVRYQLLLTLGDVAGPDAAAARNRLLFDHVEDDWMQVAAMSAAGLDELDLFDRAVARFRAEDTPGRRALFGRIGATAAAAAEPGAMRTILHRATATAHAADDWWRAATIEGLAGGLRVEQRHGAGLDPERRQLADLLARGETGPVRRAAVRFLEAVGLPPGESAGALAREAERMAADPTADPDARVDAIRLLALRDITSHEALLHEVLGRAEPAPVHIAALRALAEPKGERVATTVVKLWDRWTPAVRAEAIQALVREPGRVRVLLDAVAAGAVRTSEIDWPLRVRMMMSDDDVLRARARALFTESPAAPREAIARYQAATTMAGSPARGRDVFKEVCASCHQYRGEDGVRFGPDLGEVRGRLPPALLTDILHPNHSIADGYELWIVEMDGGTITSGIIGSETPTSVTVRMQGGSEVTLPRERIASMRIAPMSDMPEGLESSIDLQQMADLIAFIRGGQ
jgi:putative membrane-bound dehydrogenase-like protein